MSKTNNKMTFINSKSGNPRELNEIDIFFDAILNSKDTYIEDYNNGMRLTYTYENEILKLVKEVSYPASSREKTVKTITDKRNNNEVYDGKRVRDISNWLPELISMAKSIENVNDIPNKHI